MRNSEPFSGEVIAFPRVKREEPRRVFSVLREILAVLAPPGSDTCATAARELRDRFSESGDDDAQAMLVVRCGLCTVSCAGKLR